MVSPEIDHNTDTSFDPLQEPLLLTENTPSSSNLVWSISGDSGYDYPLVYVFDPTLGRLTARNAPINTRSDYKRQCGL